jgi:hypothetical protein
MRQTVKLGRSSWLTLFLLKQRLKLGAHLMKAPPLCGSSRELQPPFFIIGSGRSGTTVLRSMLVAGGEVAVPPESFVLPEVIALYKVYGFLPWEQVVKLVIGSFEAHPLYASDWGIDLAPVHREAAALAPARRNLATIIDLIYRHFMREKEGKELRWGDKTPYNAVALPEILEVFPNAQFLHILRDGRDCVSSGLDARIRRDIESAASRWLRDVAACRAFGEALDSARFLEIRYENLVHEPEATLATVCRFLGIRYQEEMLGFYRIASQLGDGYHPHHRNLHNPLSNSSVGKWRERLTPAQQDRVRDILGSTLKQLGYCD